ncbi:MAG: sulfotransferase [Sphingobium sp.]
MESSAFQTRMESKGKDGAPHVPPQPAAQTPEARPDGGRPKVFGIGLNKTGTTTLGACFQKLGYRHMGYRRDLLKAYRERRIEPVLEEIDRFESFEDWPYPLMYRELADRYPDAKFVLTVRKSAEVWFDSLARHARQSRPLRHARKLAYGYHYPDNARDAHIAFYRAHNREAQDYLGERVRVLCWEDGDQWEQLCGFIGAKVPDEPFPHINAGKTPPLSRRLSNSALRVAERWGLL